MTSQSASPWQRVLGLSSPCWVTVILVVGRWGLVVELLGAGRGEEEEEEGGGRGGEEGLLLALQESEWCPRCRWW